MVVLEDPVVVMTRVEYIAIPISWRSESLRFTCTWSFEILCVSSKLDSVLWPEEQRPIEGHELYERVKTKVEIVEGLRRYAHRAGTFVPREEAHNVKVGRT